MIIRTISKLHTGGVMKKKDQPEWSDVWLVSFHLSDSASTESEPLERTTLEAAYQSFDATDYNLTPCRPISREPARLSTFSAPRAKDATWVTVMDFSERKN